MHLHICLIIYVKTFILIKNILLHIMFFLYGEIPEISKMCIDLKFRPYGTRLQTKTHDASLTTKIGRTNETNM
jgi:hypothetical protein